ncbi:39S ribosomal protein L4, mitochondrial [Cephus cinctus]|uniref:Large ribosomal subunit protein uL4m n=1 Tax=Cephus cinctus TaxID=211228 RepID=A0AAJ7BWG6_CEPCN|nr:39S ribosomal protein L4, mitochondrial [Cephus cinctus]
MSLILRNIVGKFHGCQCRLAKFSTAVQSQSTENQEVTPIISKRSYIDEDRLYLKRREVWLENLDTVDAKKLGLVYLHPEVYGAQPRIDIIHENARWQRMYRYVCYDHTKTRAEVRGGGRKPWPQKGTGRARHGSIRSPLWKGGGIAHGPRSPTPHFYMLPFYTRVAGLASTLSVKLAQDDLHLVNELEIPTDDPAYIIDLIDARNWGPAVLFVDDYDIMPKNITMATDTIKHVNLMPVYGLNVFSMLKHQTLVLTERAAKAIEDKLVFHMNRTDAARAGRKFRLSQY